MNAEHKETGRERLVEELKKYGLISLYLYLCFSVLLLYKSAILDAQGVEYLPFGLALAKALILGKFILIGDAISVGARSKQHPLLYRIAWKSIAFLVILLVFVAIEELIVGWFHDKTVAQVAAEFLDRSWIEKMAPSALMLMILVPLVTATEMYRTFGPQQWKAWMSQRPAQDPTDP
jgi:hypothetical protein